MIHKLFFFFAFVVPNFALAQSTSPNIISATGSSFNNGTVQWDYTLGEPVINIFTDGTTVLTQGFHQPNLLITSINNYLTTYTLTIFPNPTNDVLQLHFDKLNQDLTIEIYAADGKVMYSKQYAGTALDIKVSEYPSGTYLLSIRDESFQQKTYKIIKIN